MGKWHNGSYERLSGKMQGLVLFGALERGGS